MHSWCTGSGRDGVNFPTAALMVLCFVFVARKVLTHQCFGYSVCIAWRLSSHLASPKASRLGAGKSLGGDISRTVYPTD